MKKLLMLFVFAVACENPGCAAQDCENAWMDTGSGLDQMPLSYIENCCGRAYPDKQDSYFSCAGRLMDHVDIAGPVEREDFCKDEEDSEL